MIGVKESSTVDIFIYSRAFLIYCCFSQTVLPTRSSFHCFAQIQRQFSYKVVKPCS